MYCSGHMTHYSENFPTTGTIEAPVLKPGSMSPSEVDEINEKLLNVFGIKNLITKKDNTINSLTGKCEYLKKQIENS